jgi:tetratricopeptide (TPR) repeat protein
MRAAEIHEKALSLQNGAAEARPSDWSLQREFALTLNNLGTAYSRTNRVAQACACYDQAIGIQEELARRDPNRTTYPCDLAVTRNNLGMLYARQEKCDEAKAAFDSAVKIYEGVLARQPNDVDAAVQSGLGGVYHNLGIVLEQAGELAAAAEAFGKAIKHQQIAARKARGFVRFAHYLREHQSHHARVLRQLGRHDEEESL